MLSIRVKVKSLSRVRLFVIPWTVAYLAPPSMGFSRQEYWNGLPFPSSGDLPNLGIEPRSPAFQAGSLPSEPPGKPGDYYYPHSTAGETEAEWLRTRIQDHTAGSRKRINTWQPVLYYSR